VNVSVAATTSCLERRLKLVTYSSSHRHAGTPVINIQSTLCTTHDLCKNFSLTVSFGSNRNSYTISTQSDICIYTHVLHNIETLAGQEK
jgi:hypothetical protein